MRLSFHGTLGLAFSKLYQENPHQTLLIHHCALCNSAAGNVKVRMCMCGPGETPGSDHALLWDYTINQNQVLEAFDGLVIMENFSIWALANASPGVSYTMCGDHV